MTPHSEAFDVIPFEDIAGDWKKLGSGSFGKVYKGTYLGLDVAIKEVLPSTDYDVAKYFEREWRLMKECRHPNICLFIGLSRAPTPDQRIFIVSEYIDSGNVRTYIHDKSRPFPWRLRMSFATDVARALAYLHARKCIHRDLKGENLLVTSNGRIKVTDFGFARIAARNEEELKRLTYCGTDAYMSPEIMLGHEFDLPTDIFSLGIIFCEIASRHLADDTRFKRYPPDFDLDPEEIQKYASSGCPRGFLDLCIDCVAFDPKKRPTSRQILERLAALEAEVLARPEGREEKTHLGSIKFMTGGKHPGAAPRIPSFGMGIGKDIRPSTSSGPSDDSDDEFDEAIETLSKIGINNLNGSSNAQQPLLESQVAATTSSNYSTSVIRSHQSQAPPPSASSVLTIRPSPDPNLTPAAVLPPSPDPISPPQSAIVHGINDCPKNEASDILGTSSLMSIASLDSYHTARRTGSSFISDALATEGGSTIRSFNENFVPPLVHRFTLLKPGKQKKDGAPSPAPSNGNIGPTPAGWNPLELFFSSGLLMAKCDLCSRRLGWKPVLECDDCGLRAHVKCGESAPRDCGLGTARINVQHSTTVAASGVPLDTISPLSKVRQDATRVVDTFQAKPSAKRQ
jgi:LIM domain kinase 1